MATISSTIKLNDTMSSTLTSIQSHSLQTIVTLNQMQTAVDNLTKELEEAEKINPNIVNTEYYADAVEGLENMRGKIHDISNGTDELKEEQEEYNNSIGTSITKWVSLAAIIGGAKELMDFSDTYSQTTSRLGLITDDVETLQSKIYAVASDSRASYQSVADTVAKLGMQASDAFNNSNDEILLFTDNLNKLFKTQGLDSTAIESTMYNLTQSLSSGKLLGNDYRILKQNAPEMISIIQDFYGVTRAELDDMVSAGEVSAEDIKNAMFNATDDINNKFSQISMTWEDVFTSMKNTFTKVMTPVLKFVNLLANNLDIVAPIVATLAAVIVIYTVAAKGAAVATALWSGAQAVLTLLEGNFVALILIAIALLVGFTVLITNIINNVTGSSISAMGIIVGIVYGLGAVIYDVAMGAYNIFAAIVNGIVDVFMHGINDICQYFLGLGNTALTVIDAIAKAADAVFGTNLSATTGAWLDNLSATAQSVNEALTSNNDVFQYEDLKDIGEAFNNGYAQGESWSNSISDSLSDAFSMDDISSNIDSLSSTVNDLTGTDSTGSSALKTTSNDDLLSDEDIQLLLDVATRDYQLSYQSVTPNVTVSFGDVRETADVNSVLDAVGSQIESIINGDTEVLD